jgi:tetratricopeptide (TPR) repeat protein
VTPERSAGGVATRVDFARRGEALHLRGESDEALRVLNAGLEHRPGDVTARLVLARVCREDGRDEAARDWLEAALRLDPECPAALLQLSEMPGDLVDAFQRNLYREKLAAQEPWDELFRDAGAVSGDFDQVPASLDTPAPSGETAPLPEPRAARVAPPSSSRFPVREEEEEAEIEENSAPHVATVTLAEIYLQQGLKEQAAQIYRQLLERQPGDDSVRRRLQEIEGD